MPGTDSISASTLIITLDGNGRSYPRQVQHHWTPQDMLREELDLTGAKQDCDRGECGSSTVLLAGKAVYPDDTVKNLPSAEQNPIPGYDWQTPVRRSRA